LREKCRVFKKPVYLLADEPYAEIVFDGLKAPSILKAYQNSIIAYSYSKTLSLPGERIGYIAVHPKIHDADDLVNALILCTRIMGFVNAPALMQRIVAKLQHVTVDVDIYQKKRDLLCQGLAKAGYQFTKPQGAFYLFVKSPIPDDVKFVHMLLQKTFWWFLEAVSAAPVISASPSVSKMRPSSIPWMALPPQSENANKCEIGIYPLLF